MPVSVPESSPSFDLVLALIDAHVALERAMLLELSRCTTTAFEGTLQQIELDAAHANVKVQAFKLTRVIEMHNDWINETIGPFVTDVLAEASEIRTVEDLLPGTDEAFADHWLNRLIGLIASDGVRASVSDAVSDHFLVEVALCSLGLGFHCAAAMHDFELASAACAGSHA